MHVSYRYSHILHKYSPWNNPVRKKPIEASLFSLEEESSSFGNREPPLRYNYHNKTSEVHYTCLTSHYCWSLVVFYTYVIIKVVYNNQPASNICRVGDHMPTTLLLTHRVNVIGEKWKCIIKNKKT